MNDVPGILEEEPKPDCKFDEPAVVVVVVGSAVPESTVDPLVIVSNVMTDVSLSVWSSQIKRPSLI